MWDEEGGRGRGVRRGGRTGEGDEEEYLHMLLLRIALFPGRLGPGNKAMLGMDQYTELPLYQTELQCWRGMRREDGGGG